MTSPADRVAALLTRLQAWGEPPVVAPRRLKDAQPLDLDPDPYAAPRHLALYAVASVLLLLAVLWAVLLAPEEGPGFIYQQF